MYISLSVTGDGRRVSNMYSATEDASLLLLLLQLRPCVAADISKPLQPLERPPNPVVAELPQESTREPRVLQELSEVSTELLNARVPALSQAGDISGSEWQDGEESEEEEVANLGRPVVGLGGVLLQRFACSSGIRRLDGGHGAIGAGVALDSFQDPPRNRTDEARGACYHLLTGCTVSRRRAFEQDMPNIFR